MLPSGFADKANLISRRRFAARARTVLIHKVRASQMNGVLAIFPSECIGRHIDSLYLVQTQRIFEKAILHARVRNQFQEDYSRGPVPHPWFVDAVEECAKKM